MDDKTLKDIIMQTNKDYSGMFEYLKSFYRDEYFTHRNLLIFSVILPGLFTYRYMMKTTLLREYNGHFNSPQNLLNRKLTKNYLFEATFRFIVGGIATFMALNIFKIYYLKLDDGPLLVSQEDIKMQKTQEDLSDIISIKERIKEADKYIVKIGKDQIVEELGESYANKIFSMNKFMDSRNKINKYYEQYHNKKQ